MKWGRRLLVGLLSIVLLISLVGVSLATSAKVSLNNSNKIDGWLKQSNLYSGVINKVVKQAQPTVDSQSAADTTALQEAAESALPRAEFYKDIDSFLNSNYTWLEGHTDTPVFSVNLTSIKQSFASQVGQYVEARLASLPICSATQTLQAAYATPLSLSCRPSVLTPSEAGADVVNQITTSGVFSNKSILTASSLTTNNQGVSQPYYQQLSGVPKAYRWGLRLPWVLGILAVVSILSILWAAPGKRRGWRRIAFVVLLSGLILIGVKACTTLLNKHVDSHLASNTSIQPLQEPLTNFARLLVNSMAKIDLDFGIAYLALAFLLIIALFINRRRGKKSKPVSSTGDQTSDDSNRFSNFRFNNHRSKADIVNAPAKNSESQPAPSGQGRPKTPPKPPRNLIQ